MDTYLGTIVPFIGNYAPQDWAICDGSTLQIAQNAALYSLLGTTYGGDGKTTFKLPDLRGRVSVGANSANTAYVLGKTGGSETVALTTTQMPAHNHNINVNATQVPSTSHTAQPSGNTVIGTPQLPGRTPVNVAIYDTTPNSKVQLNSLAISQTGSGVGHDNMQPFLVMNYLICISGLYPPRD